MRDGFGLQRAVRPRSDIEQEIRTMSGRAHQMLHLADDYIEVLLRFGVGGTFLSMLEDGTWLDEVAWEEPLTGWAPGGGLSTYNRRPAWQRGDIRRQAPARRRDAIFFRANRESWCRGRRLLHRRQSDGG